MEFQPLPLLGNAHVQTVLGNILRGPEMGVPTRAKLLPLDDGDHLAIYDSAGRRWQPGDPVAVLVHGLGGSHRSGSLVRLARMLLPRGYRIVRLDLRSCGRGIAFARRPYHAGSSPDVRAVLKDVHATAPGSPIDLIGFSLGGNIVLKLAGEAATEAVPGLARVVAVAPPIDLELCCRLLEEPRNRLYEGNFLRELLTLVRRRQRFFPDLPRVRFPSPLNLRIYDDLYTAPRNGFVDAADYYRQCSSLPLIPRIQLPTLIVTARDDPFVAVAPFETLQTPPHVELRIHLRGGHLGFLGWDGAGGIRWAERRVLEWLLRRRRSGFQS